MSKLLPIRMTLMRWRGSGMEGLTHAQAARWTRVGVLASFALVLGYIETFIPIPVPGVKLGLANIAILLCFLRLDAGAAFFVTLIKVLAQGLLFGSPLTFAYSLTGSLLAFAVMAATVRIPGMHPAMVSVLGAVSHTAGQMLVAAVLLGTRFVWLAAPVLAVAAVVTGAVCGILTVRLNRAIDDTPAPYPRVSGVSSAALDALPEKTSCAVGPILAGYVLFAAVVLMQANPLALGVLFALSVAACAAARVPPAALGRGVRAFAVLLVVSAVAAFLSSPPDEAWRSVAVMALRLGSVMAGSIAVMGFVSTDDLLAFTVATARRLQKRGIDTQGPLLALNVCLQTIPVLATGLDVGDARLFGKTLGATIANTYAQADAFASALAASDGEVAP